MHLTELVPKSVRTARRPAFIVLVARVYRLVTFTPLPLYPRKTFPQCPLTTNLCRTHSRFRRSGEEKVVSEIEPRAADCQDAGQSQ
jgi:hypothetical protein